MSDRPFAAPQEKKEKELTKLELAIIERERREAEEAKAAKEAKKAKLKATGATPPPSSSVEDAGELCADVS